MAEPKKKPQTDAAAWVDTATQVKRKCTICTSPEATAFLRAACAAMVARGVRVSRERTAIKLSEVAGRTVCENTLRNHLLNSHDPTLPELPRAVRG